MKAIRVHEFGEPDVMRLEEIEELKPAVGQVLARVKAVGVNPVDTYIRAGAYARKPTLPYTPGSDAAGIVEAVGEGVEKVKTGDRVYVAGTSTGAYAEFCLSDENQIFPLPENVSFEQGAGVFVPYATAFRGLFQRGGAQAGETVLIHGASGGVGIAAVQWARNVGLKIIGTASSEAGRNLVMNEGADYVFDHKAENYLAEILKITDNRGVNIILEMLANVNLQKDFDVLAMYGRIVVIGNRGTLEFNPRAAMSKDASIHGMSLFNAPPAQMAEIHREIGRGLAQGYLKPVIAETFPLVEAAKAHRAVLENNHLGKIVLIP
ncbi:MAG: NADPH:quinone reductase [Acidobacteriota bacterium]|nr:NADPH:quinone reductase [Acidobacteriota bacterium]